jgi:hypothetical protein
MATALQGQRRARHRAGSPSVARRAAEGPGMSDTPSSADPPLLAGRLLARWDRAALAVRCGLGPAAGQVVQDYLDAGRRVALYGVRPEFDVQRRMLDVLLQAARDQVLPAAWRASCVAHARRVLARLRELHAPHGELACAALQDALGAAAGLVARSGG